MKLKINKLLRFQTPTVLKGEDPFQGGATVWDWDEAFTGDMDKTLADVKQRAMGGAPKRDISKVRRKRLVDAK